MPTIPQATNASLSLAPGLGLNPQYLSLDPDEWLVTTFRALKNYILRNVNPNLYQFVASFTEASELATKQPLAKTLIHFEIDEITNYPLGMGDGVVKVNENIPDQSLTEEEAQWHDINFDVGIWASDQTGGVTARLKTYEILSDLLDGPSARERLLNETDGVEIKHFRGGRFDVEKVNDVRTYRVVDMELLVRVAGRKTSASLPYIDELVPDSNLENLEEDLLG